MRTTESTLSSAGRIVESDVPRATAAAGGRPGVAGSRRRGWLAALALLLAGIPGGASHALTRFINADRTVGTETIAAADTIIIRNGVTVTIAENVEVFGELQNRGTLVVQGSLQVRSGGLLENYHDLRNEGTLLVNPGGQFNTSQGGIAGAPAALVEIEPSATLRNDGAFNNRDGSSVVNDGSLMNTGTINSYALFDNVTGTVDNSDGDFINLGTLKNRPEGTFKNRNGGDLHNHGSITNEGELNNLPQSTVKNHEYAVSSGRIFNQSIVYNMHEAELVIDDDGSLENEPAGSIVNDGMLRNRSGGSVVNAGSMRSEGDGATIDNLGRLNNVVRGENKGEIRNIDGALLRNRGTISNADGIIENDSGATITNQFGTIDNSGFIATEAAFENLTPAVVDNANGIIHNYCDGSFVSQGTIDNLPGGSLMNYGGSVTNSGSITGPGFTNIPGCAHFP